MNASLNARLKNVEWGECRLGDLFEIDHTLSFNADRLVHGDMYDYVTRTSINQGILRKTGFVNEENLNEAGVWSLGLLQMDFFYREKMWYAGQFIRKIIPKVDIPKKAVPFFTAVLNKQKPVLLSVLVRDVDETFRNLKVKLPITKKKEIDYHFMEMFIEEMKEERVKKLATYLKANGLDEYDLTNEERAAIDDYGNIKWDVYNLEKLFGKATRGRRLKSADRIPGELPFVTAGEAEEGVSGFIGNQVHKFQKNTITIDMFGSAKYRSYNYGGDDHVAVVHTENLPENAAIFVTSAIHKSSHNGQFDYGKNFYAKDADELYISLPTKDGQPDYKIMEKLIAAIHKLVVKKTVLYVNEKTGENDNLISPCDHSV